jgi:holo-[acyl-carrier protein] synthase
MIIGIGNDLTDIRRIETSLQRFGRRFTDRIFTPDEQARADRLARPAASYAKRFAAKEACAKALGTGFCDGVFWRNLEVVNLPGGQPSMTLTGGARERLDAITPPGMTARIHLTLTDEYPLAHAVVLISAEPSTPATPATPAPSAAPATSARPATSFRTAPSP